MAEGWFGVDRRRARTIAIAGIGAAFLGAASQVIDGGSRSGTGIVVAALGIAIALVALSSPQIAVLLLLVASYLRLAVEIPGLPAEPFSLAFLAVAGAAVVAVLRGRMATPRLDGIEMAMLLFFGWNVVSALLTHRYPAGPPIQDSGFSTARFILVGTVIPFVLFVMGRYVFNSFAALRRLLWTVIVLGGHAAAISIMQFTGLEAFVWPRFLVDGTLTPGVDTWTDRAVGVFNQPVVNGLLLIITFATTLYMISQRWTGPWQRAVLVLVAVLSVWGIYLTRTRVVWLAFGIILLVGVILARGFRTGFAATLVAILGLVAINWSTFVSEDREAGGVGSSGEVDDRLNALATSFWAIEREPLTGWGIGRFWQLNTFHHQQWAPDVSWIRGFGIPSHHNELGIATELGLPGLALWITVLALIIRLLVRGLREPSTSGHGHGLAVLGICAFVVWLCAGQTVDLRFFDFANSVLMVIAGAAIGNRELGLARARSTAPGSRDQADSAPRTCAGMKPQQPLTGGTGRRPLGPAHDAEAGAPPHRAVAPAPAPRT